MKLSKLLFLWALIGNSSVLLAQYDQYKGYYQFPIRPNQENFLSGSMGELRSTHFHGGIDIKTSGVTGLPVYAAADGYISRIKITRGGYGNALYVKHTNGTTTVYAHLERFKKALQRYLVKRQYENKSWTVDLFPQKNEFVVKKGEVIAFSGNSGSSSGPHLHFEVRDANQHVLDPLRMGFDEIKDQLPPLLLKIAFVTKSLDARINGQFGRYEFEVIKSQNGFTLKEPLFLSGKIGIEIYAYDVANGTRNKYGIPDLIASLDSKVFFSQKIRDISYAKMRNILIHTNYQNSVRGGRRFNKLYVDNGNTLNFYEKNRSGILHFPEDGKQSTLKIIMSDPRGNQSVFTTTIEAATEVGGKELSLKTSKKRIDVLENIMKVTVPEKDGSHLLELFANQSTYQVSPNYVDQNGAVYLWDLCYGLPDSIDFCSDIEQLHYTQSFFPGQSATFYHPSVELSFNKSTLFDTLHLSYDYRRDTLNRREIFGFGNVEDPLRTSATVTLLPKMNYDHRYARIYSVFGKNRTSYIGGEWKGDKIHFRTRDLVRYTIDYDSVSPTITKPKLSNNQIRLTIADEKSGIKDYRAKLNGKWLLLKYDYKRKRLVTDTLDPNIPFKGDLVIEVSDNTGNKTNFEAKIE